MSERERLTLEIAIHAITGTGVGEATEDETRLAMKIAENSLDFASRCIAQALEISRHQRKEEMIAP